MLLRARVTLSMKPCDLSLFLQWLAVRTKVHAVEPEKNLRDYNHICRTEGFRDHLQDWQREEDILLKKYVNIAFSLPPSLPSSRPPSKFNGKKPLCARNRHRICINFSRSA